MTAPILATVRGLVAAATLLATLLGAPRAASAILDAPSPADALWRIVSTCIDAPRPPAAAAYCACPAMARSCCGDPATPDVDVVWSETPAFVAVRDLTACGCAAGFVAGLAMPRTRVTGIEDPARPDAIWPFAWETARARIADELAIGLAINPEVVRSQNQLHIHMLRLKPGVRDLLDAALRSDPLAWGDASAILLRLPDLGQVFTTVAARVGDAAMGAHGVLVARAAGGGFVALITDRSSPQVYTENRCTR